MTKDLIDHFDAEREAGIPLDDSEGFLNADDMCYCEHCHWWSPRWKWGDSIKCPVCRKSSYSISICRKESVTCKK